MKDFFARFRGQEHLSRKDIRAIEREVNEWTKGYKKYSQECLETLQALQEAYDQLAGTLGVLHKQNLELEEENEALRDAMRRAGQMR
ncbi:hypothetical protein TWF696_000851 [Orbilia brochopaga]|uniref:Uncharacterized protein n=1 Tax=Orbilia brochopaga TaxID=3140254 RepID=A0AAV9VCZ3_9PEZI